VFSLRMNQDFLNALGDIAFTLADYQGYGNIDCHWQKLVTFNY